MNGTLEQEIKLNGKIETSLNIKGIISGLKLKGKLINDSINIKGKLETNSNIKGLINSANHLEGKIIAGGTAVYPDYEGTYDVIPKTESQTLNTQNKILREDMLIESIPYFETSNQYGNTIYIGSEVNIYGN